MSGTYTRDRTIGLDIDLTFSVEQGDARQQPLAGRITAEGTDITVALEGEDFIGSVERPTLSSLRAVGTMLAQQGLTVTVTDARGTVARLGALPTHPVRRIFGGERVLAVGVGRAMSALHGRRRGAGETALGMPPGTLWPLVPGLTKAPRPAPTRTHSTPGSGRPRLYFVVGSEAWDGTPPREYHLGERATIGSSPDADLCLEGLPPIAAVIHHDADDEYRLEAENAGGGSALLDVSGNRRVSGRLLRTGARIELGKWRLAFFREEYADHGRPFGGRIGGELSHQRPQPPRPKG